MLEWTTSGASTIAKKCFHGGAGFCKRRYSSQRALRIDLLLQTVNGLGECSARAGQWGSCRGSSDVLSLTEFLHYLIFFVRTRTEARS